MVKRNRRASTKSPLRAARQASVRSAHYGRANQVPESLIMDTGAECSARPPLQARPPLHDPWGPRHFTGHVLVCNEVEHFVWHTEPLAGDYPHTECARGMWTPP